METKEVTQTKVVNMRSDQYDIYIGRGSKWGNPFTHIKDKKTLAKFVVKDRRTAMMEYLKYITTGEGKHLIKELPELKGKILGCYCHPQPCHGDILVKLIDKLYPR